MPGHNIERLASGSNFIAVQTTEGELWVCQMVTKTYENPSSHNKTYSTEWEWKKLPICSALKGGSDG